MGYYEKWFTAVRERLVESGLITRAELENGRPAPGSSKATPALTADQVPSMLRSGALARRELEVAPRFHPGQHVRTRNIHPTGHTRLPRYARDKQGVIERITASMFSPTPPRIRSGRSRSTFIRFASAHASFGAPTASPRDSVNIDLWDNYIEPA